jgi:hypothetical protein
VKRRRLRSRKAVKDRQQSVGERRSWREFRTDRCGKRDDVVGERSMKLPRGGPAARGECGNRDEIGCPSEYRGMIVPFAPDASSREP